MKKRAEIPLPCCVGLFEDILGRGASLRVRVTGRSMNPFLHGGEIVTIRKVPRNSLKRGDLIFFRNHEGRPVVHRIVRRGENDTEGITFQTKGDALVIPDEPVRDREILGKVCAVENGPIYMDLEAKMWSTVSCLIAAISLFESRLYVIMRALKRSVRIRRMSDKGDL